MFSHHSPGPGVDRYESSPVAGVLPPPPPPRTSDGRPSQHASRRGHGSRLPALTTNLAPGTSSHISRTPLSTTSLSSPFVTAQTTYSPIPGSSSRGPSPMAGRYSVPYNPSEWAGGSRRASQNDGIDPENGIAAPPPPYSPPQNPPASQQNTSSITSPAETLYSALSSAAPSQSNTPTTTGGGLTPSTTQDAMNGTNISTAAIHIPPPPPRGPDPRRIMSAGRARPVSVSALSQVVTQGQVFSHNDFYNTTAGYDLEARPPAAKRAASAGAVSDGGSSMPSREPSEAGSNILAWHAGVPLPGPPPGPPPAASRSHSASSSIESHSKLSSGVARHSQTYRVPLRPPLLSPMPPTPAGWTEDQPMHSMTRSPVPLQIRTTNLGVDADAYRSQTDPVIDIISRTDSNLSRSSAVRDSSARGIRERRSLRKSVSEPEAATLASLIIDTNPLSASSRTQGVMKSPIPYSGKPHDMDQRKRVEQNTNIDAPSSSRSASFNRRSGHIPSPLQMTQMSSPPSPITRMQKLQTRSLQHSQGKGLPTPPLSQKAPASAHSMLPSSNASLPDFDRDAGDTLAATSLKRHQAFLEREAQAATGEERLQVFADYLVTESVLRMRHYSGVRQVDILRIRQRLFDEDDPAFAKSVLQANKDAHGTDSKGRSDPMWWKDYQPALSPIASMGNDEMSSRGRASSRWWESQTGGSQGETGPMRRSKRESKYMGLSTSLINSMIEENSTPTFPDSAGILSADEYPVEKADPDSFGFYNEEEQPSVHVDADRRSPRLLDISRFITLPPPYPRHYPAVNNCHPQLTDCRLAVRSLSDLSEIDSRKSRQQIGTEALRNEHGQRIANGRAAFKSNIQSQIARGTITYADAAEAETVLLAEEHKIEKDTLQAEFDLLQDVVIGPLHNMLNDRLVQLNVLISGFRDKIDSDAIRSNPDRVQQEGDDTPELLEYLTLLKWLFETRETVQKEIFELLTMRNNKYKEIVLLPYRQAGNGEKVRETELFFAHDNQDRQKVVCDDSIQRYETLYRVIEDNVRHGIEVQSSAFWDIAPNLLELIQKLSELGEVDRWNQLQISESEYLENPSYYRFPQQYLYTLLEHAEKSTYQFIEGQINLHCLLHEVKSGKLLVECRKAEVAGEDVAGWDEYRRKQEATHTGELKQTVAMIEEQWAEALGNTLQGTRERVKKWLEDHDGWEEISGGD